MTTSIERREGEEMTAYTIRRIRAEILERAAETAEALAEDPDHSRSYRAGCLSSAKAIRKMMED